MILSEICAELRNWFSSDDCIHSGRFTVSDGTLTGVDFLQDGQYFRLVGSVFNDGVWQYPTADLIDESFEGAVWAMRVPPALIALAAEIKEYDQSDAAKPSPYASESFGGYSYSKTISGSGLTDNSWKTVFAAKLNKWRKIR